MLRIFYKGGSIMTQEQFKQAAEYWNKKDRKVMPEEQVKEVVEKFILDNDA